MARPSPSAHDRVRQVLQYLKSYDKHTRQITRRVENQPWMYRLSNVPDHDAVRVEGPGYPVPPDREPDDERLFRLSVDRVTVVELPDLPDVLRGWIRPGWDEIDGKVEIRRQRFIETENGEKNLVRFGEDPARPEAFHSWKEKRDAWAEEVPSTEAAADLYEELYGQYLRLSRDAEDVELMLGDGMFAWSTGPCHHPVLLRPMRITFDASVPRVTIEEVDAASTASEFYASLFQGLEGIDGNILARLRSQIEEQDPHPLEEAETTAFLKAVVHQISSRGSYTVEVPEEIASAPTIGRDPVLFVRKRGLGFERVIDGLMERVDRGDAISDPLVNITGAEKEASPSEGDGAQVSTSTESPNLLLSKSANHEQIRVGERLHQHGAVVVQGPPGTGKTHTIGNLIGDLLARGKRILVTSHTSKALRRLREQVPKPLQSLCVSVLGADTASQDELKYAVSKMSRNLGNFDACNLEKEAEQLRDKRERLQDALRQATMRLREARRSEYDALVVGGKEIQPAKAAKIVRRDKEEHGWIPGTVELEAPAPLSQQELVELYATNESIKPDDEVVLTDVSLRPADIPEPDAFDRLTSERHYLKKRDLAPDDELWPKIRQNDQVAEDDLEAIKVDLRAAADLLREATDWQLSAVDAGRRGGELLEPWQEFLRVIEATVQASTATRKTRIEFSPELHDDTSSTDQFEVLETITASLSPGETLGTFKLLWNSGWKTHINAWTVNGQAPVTYEHFDALKREAQLAVCQGRLRRYWESLISSDNGPTFDSLGEVPESVAAEYASEVERYLHAYEKTCKPAIDQLSTTGFRFADLHERQDKKASLHVALRRLQDAMEAAIDHLKSEINRRQKERLDAAYERSRKVLRAAANAPDSPYLLVDLLKSYIDEDVQAYEKAHQQLVDVFNREEIQKRRQSLIARIEDVAPEWASSIRQREAPHGAAKPPGPIAEAWRWRQMDKQLERLSQISITDTQKEIDDLRSQVQKTTATLIEKRAWASQIRRIEGDRRKRQALVGWADTHQKIGKGYGKNVPALRRAAREQMQKCREAVPVWIMPVNSVVDNFDARDTDFDVVIVDEASQVDVKGLALLMMADQVVVVGDHKQVRPSAVGEKIEDVQFLISQHLDGIPNKHLYDGKTSIYDLARQSFGGGAVGLREHFRCVPEIIQFSNALSYDFEIKPLRESSDVSLKPHVIAHRVKGAAYDKKSKLNEKEALHCASLVAAAMDDPAYEKKTMGVISLVGERQAEKIEELLRRHVDPVKFEDEHRVMTGNPAQFQGDERDVMFLSVVNAPKPEGGPLRKRTRDLFKQRFNVAASRARDQMWVIHSLDPANDLKSGDLRRRLIEHAQDPSVLLRQGTQEEAETESEFERRVLKRLQARGYDVVPQWEVGAYRIDLVVQDDDETRLAVECDGERYHPPAKLEEDMERQQILERLGWTFHRIRGSLYFRDPDRAMEELVASLDRLGIQPSGHSSVPSESDDAIRERVVRRAAELRRQWENGKAKTKGKSLNGRGKRGQISESTRPPDVARKARPSPPKTKRKKKKSAASHATDSASKKPGQTPQTKTDTPTLFDEEEQQDVKEGYGGPYDHAREIPDSVIDRLLEDKLPLRKPIPRKDLLEECVQVLGVNDQREVKSRLNKYIWKQLQVGWIEGINEWEKLKRVDTAPTGSPEAPF